MTVTLCWVLEIKESERQQICTQVRSPILLFLLHLATRFIFVLQSKDTFSMNLNAIYHAAT